MTVRDDDDVPTLTPAQQHELARFERATEVFAGLGGAQLDDAAMIATWVTHAVPEGAGATAATAGAGKLWLLGGVLAVVAGAVAIGTLADDGGSAARTAVAPTVAPTTPTATPPREVLATPPREPARSEPPPPSVAPPTAPTRAVAAPTVRAPAVAKTPATTAAELLREAAAARSAGDTSRALALYRRIGKEFADSREDKVARVAIGRLELDAGHAERALAAFDAYLRDRSTGNLAEEASFGRASALRALGRHDDERAALSDFIARFPDSIHVERARARLAGLGG